MSRITHYSRCAAGVMIACGSIACGESTSPASPAAPTNVTAVGGDSSVTISWDAVDGAAAYYIYWSDAPGVTRSSAAIYSASSPYVLRGLVPVRPYYFAVMAFNARASGLSHEVIGTPIGFVAAGGDGLVELRWTPIAGATSYNLYWSTTSGLTPATGTRIADVSSPYRHSGLVNGTAYYYLLVPVSGGVEGAPLREAGAEAGSDPLIPSMVVATPGNGQVTISWSNITGCCASSYLIRWSTHSDMSNPTVIYGAQSGYVHSGLTNGTTYYYQVAAEDVNGWGPGEASRIASATPSP